MFLSMQKTVFAAPLAALMLLIAAPQPAVAGDGHRGPSYSQSERHQDWRDRRASRDDWRDRDRQRDRGRDRRDWRDSGYSNHPCDRLARRDWDSRHDRKQMKRDCRRARTDRPYGRDGYGWWQGRWDARWDRWDSRRARHQRPHPHEHQWHPHR